MALEIKFSSRHSSRTFSIVNIIGSIPSEFGVISVLEKLDISIKTPISGRSSNGSLIFSILLFATSQNTLGISSNDSILSGK